MKLTIEKGSLRVEIKPEEFELETSCPGCVVGFMPSGAKCSTCDGTGIVLTPLGAHILDFMFRNASRYRKLFGK
jgi:hypothetical protein